MTNNESMKNQLLAAMDEALAHFNRQSGDAGALTVMRLEECRQMVVASTLTPELSCRNPAPSASSSLAVPAEWIVKASQEILDASDRISRECVGETAMILAGAAIILKHAPAPPPAVTQGDPLDALHEKEVYCGQLLCCIAELEAELLRCDNLITEAWQKANLAQSREGKRLDELQAMQAANHRLKQQLATLTTPGAGEK